MQNIIVVFLTSEFKGGDGPNIAFEYVDGSALPKIGEYVYFGSPSVRFQISSRDHLYEDDETVRIIYRLKNPNQVDEILEACLRAPLKQLGDLG